MASVIPDEECRYEQKYNADKNIVVKLKSLDNDKSFSLHLMRKGLPYRYDYNIK